ncbi:hypothetical protein M3Y95_00768400 [Aphelenchoides besseyi]|nr:hypothetical protein M3Y95_00768400 [Aphelenchoides besseyi]
MLLHEELTELLARRADIDKYDIEDWLVDAFSEGFNLILEDESIPEMSQVLYQCCANIYKGQLVETETVLSKLPSTAQTQSVTQQCAVQNDESSESEVDE